MRKFELFVTGHSVISARAIANVTEAADAVLRDGYSLDVIDLLRQPHDARAHAIQCTPALVSLTPTKHTWVLGQSSDTTAIAEALARTSASQCNGADGHARTVSAVYSANPTSGKGRPRGNAQCIVVIDDYEDTHEIIRETLEDAYVRLICARSGEVGLEAIRSAHPSLVFLDLKMPGKDGVQTLRELRRENARVAVVLMTAFAGEFMERLKSADQDGLQFELINKPLDVDSVYVVSAVATQGFAPSLTSPPAAALSAQAPIIAGE